MNDKFSKWFDEHGRKWLTSSMNLREIARGLAHAAYVRGLRDGQEVPKGLHGVSEQQAGIAITRINNDPDCMGLAEGLTQWFNDPNRDAPVKPTIHPDLEWLAQQEPFNFVTTCTGPEPILYYINDSGMVAVTRTHKMPSDKTKWTREEIERARKHLAKQDLTEVSINKRIAELQDYWTKKAGTTTSGERRSLKEERLRQLEAERDAHLLEDLDLNNLPDYETWFETHGGERTVKHQLHPLQEATVHELYTHFRARLLDELRQAGVIGDER